MVPASLDLLKGRAGLAGWIAVSNQTIRNELYFTPQRVESERRCEVAGGRVTVFKDTGDKRGRASFEISPGREKTFEEDLDLALFQAGLGGEPTYPIAGPDSYARVVLLDPEARSGDEFLGSLARSDIMNALGGASGVRLAAVEFFASKTATSVVTSEGASADNDASIYQVDLVFLAGDGAREQERHAFISRRRYQDLRLAELVKTESTRAIERLSAVRPAPGTMPVVVSPEIFGDFISYLVNATSGRSVYLKQTPLEIGKPIAEGKIKGQALILEVNALFPFGPRSYRIDPTGIAGRNVRLIDNGVFVAPHTDTQYAHYLGQPVATGEPGTPELPPGTSGENDLRSGDQIEVIQFSDLIPSVETGRFSAEIRFGYQVKAGRRQPVAGGTLSGNIREIFSNAHYSKEVGLHDDYVGPDVVRFEEGLTVTV
jgi:predicted Zn-dependent protease